MARRWMATAVILLALAAAGLAVAAQDQAHFARLPLVVRNPPVPPCDAYEPNDHWTLAWGPLLADQPYTARLCRSDPGDWYSVWSGTAGALVLELDVPDGMDYDLWLYATTNPPTLVASSERYGDGVDEGIRFETGSALYYVLVSPYAGRRSDSAWYTLWVRSAAAAPTATPVPGGDLTISGTVRRWLGGALVPLADATVSAVLCQPRTYSASSGADGSYVLLLPAQYVNACAEVRLEVRAAGYETAAQTLAVVELRVQPQRDFALLPAGSTATPTATLVATETPRSTATPTPTLTPSPTATPPANPAGLAWVAVPGGTFWMGSPTSDGEAESAEFPQHQVMLSAFRISRTEVTNGQYALFMAAGGYSNSSYWSAAGWSWRTSNNVTQPYYWTNSTWNGASYPVVGVSWYEAEAFCRWAGGRLPMEAEWEYAARGGLLSRGYKYAGGNDAGAVAWYYDNAGSRTHPVGQKLPNELGLYDMSGNVWEWCADWSGSYSAGAQTNPTGPTSGQYRIIRGGSWNVDARGLRVAARGASLPDSHYFSTFGFRVAGSPLP